MPLINQRYGQQPVSGPSQMIAHSRTSDTERTSDVKINEDGVTFESLLLNPLVCLSYLVLSLD